MSDINVTVTSGNTITPTVTSTPITVTVETGTPIVTATTSTPPPATTALSDFQAGDGAGRWIKRTLAETVAILRAVLDGAYLQLSGGTVTGDLHLNGNLILDNTFFDDLPTPLIGAKLESPSSHIVLNVAECTVEFKTTCNLTDYMIAIPQMPHRWKLGAAAHPHVHWEQTSAIMPNLLIQHRWQRNGMAKTTAWTSQKWVHNAFTYVSGTLNQITGFGPITPPVGYSLSDVVDIRLLRDVANASGLFSGVDTLAASVFAKSFDPHIEMDTLGSNEEYTK